jgi:CheY-like chemotaxis protein
LQITPVRPFFSLLVRARRDKMASVVTQQPRQQTPAQSFLPAAVGCSSPLVQDDLILMDIQLPIMDGYTATSHIKADPAFRSIPIIGVTPYALSGEEKKARAAGCDDYVPKPFSPRQLLAKIRQYLS